jgi:hypothetical protein
MNLFRWIRSKLPPQPINPGPVVFVGEQMGSTEDEIKDIWKSILARHPDVRGAYLARVRYGADFTEHISLCVACTSNDHKSLFSELLVSFQNLFRGDQHVDIRFLGKNEEDTVNRVCRPFFERK